MTVSDHPAVHVCTICAMAIRDNSVVVFASRYAVGRAGLGEEFIESIGAYLPAAVGLTGAVLTRLAAFGRIYAIKSDADTADVNCIAINN